MALRELLAVFEVKADTKELKEMDTAIASSIDKLGEIGKAFAKGLAVREVAEFVMGQIELGSQINDTAEKLGVSTDALQAFQFAAGQVGVDADSAGTALGFLNKNLGLAMDGNKSAAETFAKLGIDLSKVKDGSADATSLIPELAAKFEEAGSTAEQTALAVKVFGKQGAALIPLLKDGKKGVQELFTAFEDLGGGMSEEFIQAADDAGDQIDRVKVTVRNLKSQIVLGLLPTLTNVTVKFQKVGKELVQTFRDTKLAQEGWVIFGAAAALSTAKIGIQMSKLLGLVPKDANLLQSLFKMGQIGLIIAGVLLLALAFEDLITFVRGGDSVIGQLLTTMFGVEYTTGIVETLREAWAAMLPTFDSILPALKEAGGVFLSIAKAILPLVIGTIVDVVKIVTGAVLVITTLVKTLYALYEAITTLSTAPLDRIKDNVMGTIGTLGKLFERSAYGDAMDRLIKGGTPKAESAAITGGGERVGRFSTQQNEINIQVNGGVTNAETGRTVAGAVKGVLTQSDVNTGRAALAIEGGG